MTDLTDEQRDTLNDALERYTDDIFGINETWSAQRESAYRKLVKSLAEVGLTPADIAPEMPAMQPVPVDLIPHEPLN